MNAIGHQVKSMRDKSKCYDIFQDFKINDYKMYEYKPARNLVMYKIKREKLSSLHQKIRLLKNMRAFSGFGSTNYI